MNFQNRDNNLIVYEQFFKNHAFVRKEVDQKVGSDYLINRPIVIMSIYKEDPTQNQCTYQLNLAGQTKPSLI